MPYYSHWVESDSKVNPACTICIRVNHHDSSNHMADHTIDMHCNSLICEKHNPLNILNRCFLFIYFKDLHQTKFSFDPSMWKTQPFNLLNRCLSFICFKDLQGKQFKSNFSINAAPFPPAHSLPHASQTQRRTYLEEWTVVLHPQQQQLPLLDTAARTLWLAE